ncbi:MAG: hypothetical protein K2W96_27185 [Gemmataceae bacterium]|nr:hypothetical protein [Gemmataceae bacterium]
MRVTCGSALLAGLLLLASVGCQQKQLVKEKAPGDPLFTSKKPVEGRPHLAGAVAPPEEVPLPPPPPGS